MGKKDDDGLDKDRRKRLEEITPDWQESPSWRLKNLTVVDLRLLLEHHAPLQDLIRAIAAVPAGGAPAALAHETTALRGQLAGMEVAHGEIEDERARLQADLERAQEELAALQSHCRALQASLTECSAATQKLLQDKREQEDLRQQLENQLRQARRDLARSGGSPAELALLRADADLAGQLDLAELPADDTRALIQLVAVLAQRDNLERLWNVLKERCEAGNRPASDAERALLGAALGWYNHNWRTKPYRLVDAAPGAAYDYEQQLRCRQTAAGETVNELRLPGIADGSGRLRCKALVSTR